jgi:hypothetical protein
MLRITKMNKSMNKYISIAKKEMNANPLLEENVTREILDKSDKGILKSNFKHFTKLKGAIYMITLSSVTALFIAAALYLMPVNNNNKELIQNVSKNKVEITNNTDNTLDSVSDNKNIVTDDDEDSLNVEKPRYEVEINLSKSGATVDIPLLILNDEELKNLNIIKKDYGYEVLAESIYNIKDDPRFVKIFEENKYPEEGIYKAKYFLKSEMINFEMLSYKNWDMKKSDGIYPIMMESFGNRTGGGTNSFTNTFGTSPLINPKFDYKIFEEISRIDTSLVSLLEKMPEGKYNNSTIMNSNNWPVLQEGTNIAPMILNVSKLNYKFANKMIIIMIKWKDNGYNITSLVWFVPTKELIKKLPQRLNDFTKNIIKPVEFIDSDFDSSPSTDDNSKRNLPNNINGIESLELTLEEISKLNIRKDSVKYYTNFQAIVDPKSMIEQFPDILPTIKKKFSDLGYGENFTKGIMRNEVIIDTNGISSQEINYSGWDLTKPSPVLPVAVSSELHYCVYNKYKNIYNSFTNNLMSFSDSPLLAGNNGEIFSRDKEGHIIAQTDKLLPVRIIDGIINDKDSSKIKYRDIKFWFVINKEFAELLPDRYRIPILKELNLISSIEEGKMQETEACEILKGEKSYLDICRMGSDNISDLKIYPNPSDGQSFTVKCNFNEIGTIFVDLYDNSGKLIGNVSKTNINSPGEQAIIVNLNEKLSAGLYLVNVSDGKSNPILKKLIVSK